MDPRLTFPVRSLAVLGLSLGLTLGCDFGEDVAKDIRNPAAPADNILRTAETLNGAGGISFEIPEGALPAGYAIDVRPFDGVIGGGVESVVMLGTPLEYAAKSVTTGETAASLAQAVTVKLRIDAQHVDGELERNPQLLLVLVIVTDPATGQPIVYYIVDRAVADGEAGDWLLSFLTREPTARIVIARRPSPMPAAFRPYTEPAPGPGPQTPQPPAGPQQPPAPGADVTPPPALASFRAETGTAHMTIRLTLGFPPDVGDYASLKILRRAGATPPTLADCKAEGAGVARVSEVGVTSDFTRTEYVHDTGNPAGESFSFTVCITDAAGNVQAGNTAADVPARDVGGPQALATFTAATGAAPGEITITVGYPAPEGDAGMALRSLGKQTIDSKIFDPITDYARVDIRRTLAPAMPAAACNDGVVVASYTEFTSDRTILDQTGSPGNVFNYRACLYDSGNNRTSSQTATATARAAISMLTQHRVFVTSLTYTGNLGGLTGADQKCQMRANAAVLGGTWRALLSNATVAAKDRIAVNGPVYLVDNTTVVDPGDLWDGALDGVAGLGQPIDQDETGTPVGAVVVWGSNINGQTTGDGVTCQGWMSGIGNGLVGSTLAWMSGWLVSTSMPCVNPAALYCIEQ